MKVQEVPNRWP